MRLPIAMQLTREDLDSLNPQQLQQVADFIAFLQFRDRPRREKITRRGATIDPALFAAIADFSDDDRELAEMGMSDYALSLSECDSDEDPDFGFSPERFRISWEQAMTGQTLPLSVLWEDDNLDEAAIE